MSLENVFERISADDLRKIQGLKFINVQTLLAINDYFTDNQWMPSIRDLASDLKLGSTTVYARINQLEELGLIRRGEGARTIAFTDFGQLIIDISLDEELLDESTS